MTSKKLPWACHMLLQYVALGAAMIVLLLGAYVSTLTHKPSEPVITHPRYATVQEEKAYEEKQLADTLKAIQENAR